MELVRFIGTSPEAASVFDRAGGRRDSGRGCLRLTAGSPADTVVISNDHARNWYLKRDWRPYDLLMMAVHSSRDDCRLNITIASGTGRERAAASTSHRLQRGWNAIRLDVEEVAEHLPLDDIREIRLAMSGTGGPVEARFDDIILTGSREDLFGDPRNQNGELYLQRVGRHWNIGAGGRFELTLANGQIVGWYNTANDPHRLRNLVRGAALGPSPVVINARSEDMGAAAALGNAVVMRSEIIEANAVRAVVACDWRFVEDPRGPLADRPFRRWAYTIYATGQVYVGVESTAKAAGWSPERLGLAVTVRSSAVDELRTEAARVRDRAAADDCFAHGVARSSTADALLLFVPSDPGFSGRVLEQSDPSGRYVSFVAVSDAPATTDVREWECHLLLSSAGVVSDEETFARAADYSEPARLGVTVGTIVPGGSQVRDGSGFVREKGCYRIAPADGRVRFTVDGRTHPRFSPAFEVLDQTKRTAWVYADHLLVQKVARAVDGNLVFQLPGVIRDRTLVEVLFGEPAAIEGG